MLTDTTIDPTITEAMLEAAFAAAPAPFPELVSTQDDLDELGAGPVAPATPPQAIANARQLHDDDVWVDVGFCLRTVRGPEFKVASLYPDAETAWEEAELKHRETDPLKIPRGAPIFWVNGRFGHVALSVGGGLCWTTDYRRAGYVDLAPIAALGPWCGGRLVGWAEDLNGVDVWPNERQQRDRFDIHDRIRVVRRALRRARDNDAPRARIAGLEEWLGRLDARAEKR